MNKTKNKLILSLLLISLSGLLITSCSMRYHDMPAFSAIPLRDTYNYSVGRFKTSYLADQIHAYYRGRISGPIAVATFVDIDDLYGTSTFGRTLAEQLMGELVMRGYNIVELRKADAIQIMSSQGEFALSREVSTLRSFQDLSGIVVGTYVDSPVRVYVNARLIDPTSTLIVSAASVEMQKTDEIARLIRRNVLPASLERIPVRHIGTSSHPIPYYWPYNTPAYYKHYPNIIEEHEAPSRNHPLSAPQPSLEPTS
jgi:TolB-like protein